MERWLVREKWTGELKFELLPLPLDTFFSEVTARCSMLANRFYSNLDSDATIVVSHKLLNLFTLRKSLHLAFSL